jgi:hypothetical protein
MNRWFFMSVNQYYIQNQLCNLICYIYYCQKHRKSIVFTNLLQKWNSQTFLRKAKFHTEKEAKWTSKPQKSKVFRLPFLISQQKRLFDQNSFTIQMSLEVFQSKISHENESHKILLWRLFRLFFGMKFYMPNMWTY